MYAQGGGKFKSCRSSNLKRKVPEPALQGYFSLIHVKHCGCIGVQFGTGPINRKTNDLPFDHAKNQELGIKIAKDRR